MFKLVIEIFSLAIGKSTIWFWILPNVASGRGQKINHAFLSSYLIQYVNVLNDILSLAWYVLQYRYRMFLLQFQIIIILLTKS